MPFCCLECEGKFNLDGICIEGYAPEDCCQCAPGYTMNQNGECKKSRFNIPYRLKLMNFHDNLGLYMAQITYSYFSFIITE